MHINFVVLEIYSCDTAGHLELSHLYCSGLPYCPDVENGCKMLLGFGFIDIQV